MSRKYKLQKHIEVCPKYLIRVTKKEYECKLEKLEIECDCKIEKLEIECECKLEKLEMHYESRLLELEIEIEKLKSELKELKSKPATINYIDNKTYNIVNNYIENNFTPITQELLDEHAKTMTIKDVLSVESLAKFALSNAYINIICTDYARRICKYLKSNPQRVFTDNHLREFAHKFFKAIYPKAWEMISDFLVQREERNCLLHEDRAKYQDLQLNIKKASLGIQTEIHPEFIRIICAKTRKQNMIAPILSC